MRQFARLVIRGRSGRRSGCRGWRSGAISGWRRNGRTAVAGSHLLPLGQLVRCQDVLELRGGRLPDILHFGALLGGGKRRITAQIAHLLLHVVKNRLRLRFLVVGQIERLDDSVKTSTWPGSHSRRGLG